MVSVLSIDGGGVRGVIPLTFLIELEKRSGKRICELFDLIAGTSTGGIIAASLTIPSAQGGAKYSAKDVRNAYFEYGDTVFHRSLFRFVRTLGGLLAPKYSPRNLERLLYQFMGEAYLHETLTDILVSSYDMASSTPWFFKSSFAKAHRALEDDPLLTQVVRATTAAPTYFPPLRMESHCFIDGGVFASNPALCALAEARRLYPEETHFFIVSLGTGLVVHNRPCRKIEGWGIAGWAVPITDVMLNSSSASIDYEMRTLVGSQNYTRFQVQLDKDANDMDDASKENMLQLEMLAKQEAELQSGAIDRISRILKYK